MTKTPKRQRRHTDTVSVHGGATWRQRATACAKRLGVPDNQIPTDNQGLRNVICERLLNQQPEFLPERRGRTKGSKNRVVKAKFKPGAKEGTIKKLRYRERLANGEREIDRAEEKDRSAILSAIRSGDAEHAPALSFHCKLDISVVQRHLRYLVERNAIVQIGERNGQPLYRALRRD